MCSLVEINFVVLHVYDTTFKNEVMFFIGKILIAEWTKGLMCENLADWVIVLRF